ncbi:MAG: HDOD domain-containing protein [Planctomycetota bacterium]
MFKPENPESRVHGRPRYRLDPPHIAPTTDEERYVYRRLFEMGSTGEFHIEDVAELVENHPPISKRLIRATNSMRYGLRRRISRLKHAIVMLGARGIREFSEPVVHLMDQKEQKANKQENTRVPAPKGNFGRAQRDSDKQ